jgi:serine/threonine-protein kinase
MLVDAAGNRINAAPVEVLRDPQATSGSTQVVNGLSCMACHRTGVISVKDEVRHNTNLSEEATQKVQQLFRGQREVDNLLTADALRYVSGLLTTVGPFLNAGEKDNPSLAELPEPIGFVARRFRYDLRIENVACELGVEDIEGFQKQITEMPELLQLGLKPLITNSTIKRDALEQATGGTSLFQRTALELRLGAPTVER